MSPVLISHDGRWWWDGHAWRSRLVEGELDLFWFTSTPQWFERIALTGLIALIPIVGTINLYGWTLVATDMVRRRWRELPPAGFQYLERGVNPFVVGLVYGLVYFFLLVSLVVALVALLLSGRGQLMVVAAVAIGSVLVALVVAWWLATLYFLSALLTGSDRLGIARALDPRTLFRLARKNQRISLQVALTYGVAMVVVVAAGAAIPLGGIAAGVALPAVFAMVVPKLASFEVDG